MLVEFDNISLAVKQILGKVPFDFSLGQGSFQMLVKSACIVPNDINFAQHFESNGSKSCLDPVLNLLLTPRFLFSKLVARVAKDLQATATKRLEHFFILTIVAVG